MGFVGFTSCRDARGQRSTAADSAVMAQTYQQIPTQASGISKRLFT
jgi:hypothetical protein